MAALDRVHLLLEPVGLDLTQEDDRAALRAAFKKAHGCLAEAELARYLVASEVSEAAGNKEDNDFKAFEAIPIESAADLDAYVAYAVEHAETVHEGERGLYQHRLTDRLVGLLRERLAA